MGNVRAYDPVISVQERFKQGDCHVLAGVLHDLTGWPVHALLDHEGDLSLHAFVVRPDGLALDIDGLHEPEDLVREYGGTGHAPARPGALREQWGETFWGACSHIRALLAARTLLTEHADGQLAPAGGTVNV